MAQAHTIEVHEQGFDEIYTVHTEQKGDGWIGWIQELPEVNCERKTKKELLKVLEIELHERLEAYRVEAAVWDKQFEEDVKAGRLDHLGKKARKDFRAGRCTDL